MKIKKKEFFWGRGVGGGGRVGEGGRGWIVLGGGGVRVDVNEELKFLGKFKKKNWGWGGPGGGGGGSGWGVRVDVNEELKFLLKFKKKFRGGGSGGGVGLGGQAGCERRIEVFVEIQKKTIFLIGGGVRGGLGRGVRMDVNEELKFL